MYDPITIFLIALGLFSVGLFLLLCSLPREVPLALVVKLVWWCWILFTFACVESLWFLHQILRRVLLGIVFLAVGSSLSSLYVSCHSLLACRVSVEKSSGSLMGVPLYVICHFSCIAFYILSLFVSLIAMCLGVFLLGIILSGTRCASWAWLTISFPMFRKFSAIIF